MFSHSHVYHIITIAQAQHSNLFTIVSFVTATTIAGAKPLFHRIFLRLCTNFGSGALSGKMLLVRIVENNIIDAYFRAD